MQHPRPHFPRIQMSFIDGKKNNGMQFGKSRELQL